MLAVLTHLKSAAAGPHRLPRAQRARWLSGMPRPEEMEPQLLMGSNPQVPLVDSDEDGRLCDGVGVEVVKLHAIVMRERQHELVCWEAETVLVKRHEAHDIPVAWPRLRLARRSNPLWPVGVGNRAEKAVVDERLQRLHGHVGRTPRIRREDDRAAGHCAVEDAAMAVNLSLSLSKSLSPSPFSLLLPDAL